MEDLRTVTEIEYGCARAERIPVNRDLHGLLNKRYIAFDTETTGLDPENDRIVELGAVLFENGRETGAFRCLVNPGTGIPAEAAALNHITGDMLDMAPEEKEAFPFLFRFLGDAVSGETPICGHVAAFDMVFLCRALDRLGMPADFRFIDTREMAVRIPELERHSLGSVAAYYGVPAENAHYALEDALMSGRILWKMLETITEERGQKIWQTTN